MLQRAELWLCWKVSHFGRVGHQAGDADANNLENQRRVLADCVQVFEDVGSGASWNRTEPNRPEGLPPARGDCVKVAALDRLGRSLTEVLGTAGLAEEETVAQMAGRYQVHPARFRLGGRS